LRRRSSACSASITANGRFEGFYNFADLELDTDAPSVLLTAPPLNDIIPAGASYELAWQAEDAVGVTSIRLLASFDHGITWQNIAILPGEATHASWSVSPAALGAVLLQVVAADEAGNEGVALGSASISSAPRRSEQARARVATAVDVLPRGVTVSRRASRRGAQLPGHTQSCGVFGNG
jgi:hypothetical protein